MGGIIVFFISLWSYIFNKKYLFIVGLFILYTGGMYIIPSKLGTIKISDLAIILVFITGGYELLKGNSKLKSDPLRKPIIYLGFFFIISGLFSVFYYSIPISKVLTVLRGYIYFLCFYIFRNINYLNIKKSITILAYLTIITGVIFLLQLIVHHPLLYTRDEFTAEMSQGSESFGGLIRFTNYPPLRNMFIFLSFFAIKTYNCKIKKIYQQIILISTLIFAFARSAIMTVFVPLGCGIMIKKPKYIKRIIIILIIVSPLMTFVLDSLNQRNTFGDIEYILNGDFKDYVTGWKNESTTMTYRFAWVYERYIKLQEMPILTWFFGFGWISEVDPLASKMYSFNIIDYGGESDTFQLLYSADIGFGNFITRFGILGTLAMLYVWITLFKQFWRHKEHPIMFSALLYLINLFFDTFASRGISETYTMIPFLLLYSYYKSNELQK